MGQKKRKIRFLKFDSCNGKLFLRGTKIVKSRKGNNVCAMESLFDAMAYAFVSHKGKQGDATRVAPPVISVVRSRFCQWVRVVFAPQISTPQ